MQLTEKAQPILRGEQTIAFRKDAEKPKKKGKSTASAGEKPDLPHDTLWQALKNKRLELAKTQSVPPYVIFHDSSLLEIHQKKPRTLDAFALISGVGQSKLQRYGEAFIRVVCEHGD